MSMVERASLIKRGEKVKNETSKIIRDQFHWAPNSVKTQIYMVISSQESGGRQST